jgi:hypothetical protein
LLVAVSLLAYAPIWNSSFLADDFAYTSMYANRPFSTWTKIAAADWTLGVWGYQFDEMRSAMALAFWVGGRLWPLYPAGYHLTNLLFHAGSVLLIFFLALTLFPGNFAAALYSAILFSLHPVHAEAVSWISGRADPMCAFFSLASLLTYVLHRERGGTALYILSLAAFVGALFSKEIAIAFPLLLLGYDLLRSRRVNRGIAGYFVLLAAYLLLRRSVFPHAIREDQLAPSLFFDFAYRQAEYLRFLVPLRPAIATAIAAAAVLFFLRHRWEVLFFGAWWYLACVAPLIVTYSSPRHLYLASAGICLLAPKLLPRRAFHIAAISLAVLCAAMLVRANLRWSSAGRISDSARRGIETLARTIPPDAGLILDIPETRENAYLWLSSLPFALEPPFASGVVYAHFRIVERPLTYRYWSGSPQREGQTWIDDRLPVLRNLAAQASPCYRVSVNRDGAVLTSPVSRQELVRLLEIVSSRKPYDSIFELNRDWVDFWRK